MSRPCLGHNYLGHIWAMSLSCLGHVWVMSGPCLGHIWTVSRSCLDHVWAISGPCLGHVWTMSGPCLENVRAMSGPCQTARYSARVVSMCHKGSWPFSDYVNGMRYTSSVTNNRMCQAVPIFPEVMNNKRRSVPFLTVVSDRGTFLFEV